MAGAPDIRQAVILAGGQNLNFSPDKAWAKIGNQPLIEVLVDALRTAGCEAIIAGPKDRFGALGCQIIEDAEPSGGPLAALGQIWKEVCADKLFLVACDMPFLPPAIIEALWQASHDVDLALIERDNLLFPLPGIYGQRTQQPIDDLLAEGRRDLRALTEVGLRHRLLKDKKLKMLDPDSQALWNVNTPYDLQDVG